MDTRLAAEWATLVQYSSLLIDGCLKRAEKICPVKLTVKMAGVLLYRRDPL